MSLLILTFALALVVTFYMVPLVSRIAVSAGLLDKPDGNLKLHNAPIPYLGGLAIYLGFLVSLGLTVEFRQDVLGLLLAGTLVLLLGLIDDMGGLRPSIKIVGQFIAISVLIKSGVWVQVSAFPVWVNIAITAVGMIALINAMNLIDVMDGLAAGVAVIASLMLCVVGISNDNPVMAAMSLALVGSLCGFLWHNFPPASIFMGDAGSLFLGFMLSALAIRGEYTAVHSLGFVVPFLILSVPIFDVLLVVAIRALNGYPVYRGSPDHFALRLRTLTWSVRRIVVSSYTAALVLGVIAVAVMHAPVHIAIVLTAIATLFLVIVGLWLSRVRMARGR